MPGRRRSAVRERPHPRIEPLGRQHDRAAFSCGVPALDDYLHRRAAQDQRRRAAATFVLVGDEPGEVAGFYTLSATAVLLAELPDELARRLPRYPLVPATLLGRLGVDVRHRGRGAGELLLLDALHRSWQHASVIASALVVVDVKDDAARGFYERYGFVALSGVARRLFVPMRTLDELFGR